MILDSTLRIPPTARVLDSLAATTVITTDRSDPRRRDQLRSRGVEVVVVADDGRSVDVTAALAALRRSGTESVLIEGGAEVITAVLAAGVVDRLVVAIAPVLIGAGVEAVGALGTSRVGDGIALTNRSIHAAGDDVLIAWDVVPHRSD